jgi:hypothetical protein
MNSKPLAAENATLQGHVCKNCTNEFSGKFCNLCGEKIFSPYDRSVIHFLGDIVHLITHADGKILRNLKLMFFSPGLVSKNIASGRRQPFIKPISMVSLFIFCSGWSKYFMNKRSGKPLLKATAFMFILPVAFFGYRFILFVITLKLV